MQKIHQFEKVTLSFLKQLINIKSSTELIELITLYLTKFKELENDPFESMIIKNFDIISFLESKLYNEDFATIAQSRRQKKDQEIN